ncbi:GTPase RhebL1 [Prinia subflava]|uniref:GTPase RhebL1 n=1 Tax=Prinia subflava TaxID=208062 RepID=UPI002FE2B325
MECYERAVGPTYNRGGVVGTDGFQLQLGDTARQDEDTILPHSFITGIHGYVLICSVTSLQSFQVVKTLHKKLYEPGETQEVLMPMVLVGNKADLALQSWEVRTDEGKESWESIFLESSAKESQVTTGISMKSLRRSTRWTIPMADPPAAA